MEVLKAMYQPPLMELEQKAQDFSSLSIYLEQPTVTMMLWPTHSPVSLQLSPT
jgi:hypothetical protein